MKYQFSFGDRRPFVVTPRDVRSQVEIPPAEKVLVDLDPRPLVSYKPCGDTIAQPRYCWDLVQTKPPRLFHVFTFEARQPISRGSEIGCFHAAAAEVLNSSNRGVVVSKFPENAENFDRFIGNIADVTIVFKFRSGPGFEVWVEQILPSDRLPRVPVDYPPSNNCRVVPI